MAFRRLDMREREGAAIAELAMTSEDHAAFRDALLDRLDRLIGFDLASMHGARDPGKVSTCVRGYDARSVEERFPSYMVELSPHEITTAEGDRPVIDTEVTPRRRRERLSLYREQLLPHGVSVMATTIWRNREGAFGFHLARTGRGASFLRGEVDALSAVLPAIRLAESYLSARAPVGTPTFDSWADCVGLTKAEGRVGELAARGLQNNEIAAILGVSRLTVRNQLGAVFRKADVSNRAELAFLSSSPEAPRSYGEPPPWSAFLRPRRR